MVMEGARLSVGWLIRREEKVEDMGAPRREATVWKGGYTRE